MRTDCHFRTLGGSTLADLKNWIDKTETLADAYMEVETANLMRYKTCGLFDAGQPCGRPGQHDKVPTGADFDQSDLFLSGRAHPRATSVILPLCATARRGKASSVPDWIGSRL